MISYCSNITYPTEWGFKREPARPVDLRIDYCGGMKFDDNFDWDNLWYDAIQINDNIIVLIGPPLYDTKNWLKTNAQFEDENNNTLSFNFIELDRVCYTVLATNVVTNTVTLLTPNTITNIKINKSENEFKNKSVMVTLQKNNPIEWIQEFINYHHNVLGVEGFLIYDNNSTDYDIIKLEYSLKLTGAIIQVVNWPYPYGPQGSDFAPWDSDFGQYVMLEHAKLRYLGNAALVLNNDIDEMVVTKNITLRDITNYLTNGNVHCLKYKGIWIQPFDIIRKESADIIPFKLRDVRNYYCTDPNYKTGIGYKWMLVPNNITMNQQWLVHHINGQMIESNQLFYAHHLALNTNWSWKRDKFTGNVDDLIIDQLLLDKFKKI
jgi:hypothetical protein